MTDLVKILDELYEAGIRVIISPIVDGYSFAMRDAPDAAMNWIQVGSAAKLAEQIHLRAITEFPASLYAARHASTVSNDGNHPAFPTGGLIEDAEAHNVNIQILTGQPLVKLGRIAMILPNAPISALTINGEELICPAVSMPARQAMEIGMNMIYIAKVAETYAQAQG